MCAERHTDGGIFDSQRKGIGKSKRRDFATAAGWVRLCILAWYAMFCQTQ